MRDTSLAGLHPDLDIDACRAQLIKIANSPDFEATERERKFLNYIVEETLQGRGDRIKAYSIAIEVFGREASFDPQSDPIVRVVAGHLRRALERYYLKEGNADVVVINIPKGSYVPQFTTHKSPGSKEDDPRLPDQADSQPSKSRKATAAFWRSMVVGIGTALVIIAAVWFLPPPESDEQGSSPEIPRVLVTRLEDISKSSSSGAVAKGLTQEIVAELSKFREIVVIQSSDNDIVDDMKHRFVLSGSVEVANETFHLRIRLMNRDDGVVLWAKRFDGALKASELVQAQSLIASSVATALAQSNGVIFQADSTRDIENPPDDWAAYSCTLSYYGYRTSVERRLLPGVRECLEKAVRRYPDYATAWALLAQTYLEDIRFRIPYDPDASPRDLEKALATARHAVRLDPYNTRGLQAEMFALFFSRQFEAAEAVGERAIRLNPNDTELMGEYGYRLAVSGDWATGCPLIAEARSRNPGMFGYYESGLALCSYFAGKFAEAEVWIKKTPVPSNPIYHLMAAAIYAEAGQMREAERELAWLCENQPLLLRNLRLEASIRLGRARDIDFFIASIDRIGGSAAGHEDVCSRLEAGKDKSME